MTHPAAVGYLHLMQGSETAAEAGDETAQSVTAHGFSKHAVMFWEKKSHPPAHFFPLLSA